MLGRKIDGSLVSPNEFYLEVEKKGWRKGLEDVFIAFIRQENGEKFDVYLINHSSNHFKRMKILTWAFCSDESSYTVTSKSVRDHEDIKPYSAIKIDKTDIYELDFVIVYYVDFFMSDGEIKKYKFTLGKGSGDYDKFKTMIPIIDEEGKKIRLENRKGKVIDEEIKTMNMDAEYHEYDLEESEDDGDEKC